MTLTDEQIKQRDAAYEEWVSARSPTLRTRHNEVIHNHGFEAGYKAALSAQPAKPAITEARVIELAHRTAWRYKKSSDPSHSNTYTFNKATLLHFAALLAAEGNKP